MRAAERTVGFDWVTSDTHFSHARIIALSNRPFASVEEMDEAMIERWNEIVKPEDIVVHLGDLALGRLAESLPLTERLNGRRFLIPGNHDRISQAFDHGKSIDRFTPVYEAAGWSILPEVIEMTVAGRQVLLSHYPYDGDSRPDRPDRHAHIRAQDTGLPIIHGHVHGEWAVRGRQFNVGVDIHDFRPVHRTVIEEWLRELD